MCSKTAVPFSFSCKFWGLDRTALLVHGMRAASLMQNIPTILRSRRLTHVNNTMPATSRVHSLSLHAVLLRANFPKHAPVTLQVYKEWLGYSAWSSLPSSRGSTGQSYRAPKAYTKTKTEQQFWNTVSSTGSKKAACAEPSPCAAGEGIASFNLKQNSYLFLITIIIET